MEINEQKIKEYVVKGGELFNITLIDKIRDGGTVIIKTTKDIYYADKNTHKLHHSYPITDANQINDPLLKLYIMDRLQVYMKRMEEEVKRNKIILPLIETNLL